MATVHPMPALTLADRLWPYKTTRSWLAETGLVVLFSTFVAVCAQIRVPLPFTPVPVTAQTLAVLLTGASLGSRRGALAMVVYLVQGASGLPVFAGGPRGAAEKAILSARGQNPGVICVADSPGGTSPGILARRDSRQPERNLSERAFRPRF